MVAKKPGLRTNPKGKAESRGVPPDVQRAVDTDVRPEMSTTVRRKKATFNLPADLHKRLKVAAADHELEMVEIVKEALEMYLKALTANNSK